jgi:hypothetical protein
MYTCRAPAFKLRIVPIISDSGQIQGGILVALSGAMEQELEGQALLNQVTLRPMCHDHSLNGQA